MDVIILAAGIGSRMKNPSIPKTLIPVDHVPMIVRIMTTLAESKLLIGRFVLIVRPEEKTVFEREIVRYLHTDIPIHYITQEPSDGYGTAAAVQSLFRHNDPINEWNMILNGDMPLLEARHLEQLQENIVMNRNDLVVGTLFLGDPSGYGRVLHNPLRIVEQKEIDALPPEDEVRSIREVNTGIYLIRKDLFLRIREIDICPITNEKKLTDICRIAQDPRCFSGFSQHEVININTPLDRNYAEYILFKKRQEDVYRSLFTLLRKEMKFP